MIDPVVLLEILNGGAITPELICIVLLARYLIRESRRRGLRPLDWFHLPPSMDLVLAVFIFDVGACLRAISTWLWSFQGAGGFSIAQASMLIFSVSLLMIGALCKVRALTRPDKGNRPWKRAAIATALAMALLFVIR